MGYNKLYDNIQYIYDQLDMDMVSQQWNRSSKFNYTSHVKLWTWLRDNPTENLRDWPGWQSAEFIFKYFIYRNYYWPILLSYPCHYMIDNFMNIKRTNHLYAYCRILCPLKWPNGLECWNQDDGCFKWYSRFHVHYNYIADTKDDPFYKDRIYEIADKISKLEVKDTVQYY